MSSPYDGAGLDPDGYGRDGYDAVGFDRYGYDREGYNATGYDQYGYDRSGRDHLGRDRDGFHIDGYNTAGFDVDGYDRAGFNRYGYDRTGHDRTGKRHPDPPPAPTARDSVIGLAGGGVLTVVVTMAATWMTCWMLGKVSRSTDLWSRISEEPPQIPTGSTAALIAAGFALVAIALVIALSAYAPAGLRAYRLLVWLIAAVVVIAVADGHAAPTWIATILVVVVAANLIFLLTCSIRPRRPPGSQPPHTSPSIHPRGPLP